MGRSQEEDDLELDLSLMTLHGDLVEDSYWDVAGEVENTGAFHLVLQRSGRAEGGRRCGRQALLKR